MNSNADEIVIFKSANEKERIKRKDFNLSVLPKDELALPTNNHKNMNIVEYVKNDTNLYYYVDNQIVIPINKPKKISFFKNYVNASKKSLLKQSQEFADEITSDKNIPYGVGTSSELSAKIVLNNDEIRMIIGNEISKKRPYVGTFNFILEEKGNENSDFRKNIRNIIKTDCSFTVSIHEKDIIHYCGCVVKNSVLYFFDSGTGYYTGDLILEEIKNIIANQIKVVDLSYLVSDIHGFGIQLKTHDGFCQTWSLVFIEQFDNFEEFGNYLSMLRSDALYYFISEKMFNYISNIPELKKYYEDTFRKLITREIVEDDNEWDALSYKKGMGLKEYRNMLDRMKESLV